MARVVLRDAQHLHALAPQALRLRAGVGCGIVCVGAGGHRKRGLALRARAYERAILGDAQARIEHHAQRLVAGLALATAGEQRVVGHHRVDAHGDGGQAVAQLVGIAAGLGAAHPAGVARRAGDLAVGAHGPFRHHVRGFAADVAEEDGVELVAFAAQRVLVHADAGFAQLGRSLARHQRVRVAAAHHHARNAGGDERLGARGLLAGVAARLERDVGRCAACMATSRVGGRRGFGVLCIRLVVGGATRAVGKRVALRVRLPALLVQALADDAAVAHEHAAHQRVRVRPAPTAPGQLDGAAHEAGVIGAARVHRSAALRFGRHVRLASLFGYACHGVPFLLRPPCGVQA